MLSSDSPAFRKWQTLTVMSLLMGYAGYYVCRSNLSIATPLLLNAFAADGLTKERIGYLSSVGTVYYVVGTFLSGVLCEWLGGRRMFMFGMIGSAFATVWFGFGAGFTVFLLSWSLNRAVQSTGWSALVKVASNWFSYEQYGRTMGILCLSFLFGDAAARLFLGGLVSLGASWQEVFFASAGVLFLISLFCAFYLKESPTDLGMAEPETSPAHLFANAKEETGRTRIGDLLMPFLSSPSFWLILALSLCLTLIREAFSLWSPIYLSERGGMSPGAAGSWSLMFPFCGGFSVLFGGYMTDRWLGGKRGGFMMASLLLLVGVLLFMARFKLPVHPYLPVASISVVSFLMMAPYAFLTGTSALDLGGRKGSSTAAGLIGGAGHFGGILSGAGVGILLERSGWNGAFGVLAGVAAVAAVVAGLYWRIHEQGG